MKKICRIIAVNLIISLLSIFPGIALASSNGNPATVKAGTWYNLKDEYPAPVYRFKVADNAIVTIDWKGNKNGEIRFAFHIDQNCEHEVYTTYYLHDEKGIEMFSLSKGTYYLLMENNGGVKTAKARVLVQKAPDQGNYKKSKAVSLGANKVAYIANTPDCCYTRWYKIKLNPHAASRATINETNVGVTAKRSRGIIEGRRRSITKWVKSPRLNLTNDSRVAPRTVCSQEARKGRTVK